MANEEAKMGACFGAAAQVAALALADTGGKVLIMQSAIPTIGVGKLEHRDDATLYSTDKEKDLYMPQVSFDNHHGVVSC